jgi:hypothetical protein
MATLTSDRRTATPVGRTIIVGLLAGLVAAVANTLWYVISRALFSVPYIVQPNPSMPLMDLPVSAIFVTCLIPGFGAALIYWALGRFTARPTRIFIVIAAIFAVISCVPAMIMPVELSTRLALSTMHFIAGAIITYGLTRYASQG